MANAVPPDMSWFSTFPIEDQVRLLSDPGDWLSPELARRLHKAPGLWWWKGAGEKALLSPEAEHRVAEVAAQLDHWWQHALSSEQREYILSHRADELADDYAEAVKAANENPLGDPPALFVVLVRDSKNNNQFRLPPLIRAYVELVAREAAAE